MLLSVDSHGLCPNTEGKTPWILVKEEGWLTFFAVNLNTSDAYL